LYGKGYTGRVPQNREEENPMKEMAILLSILAAWILLQSVVLPYLGVST
jgi:hypothetical protein